MNKNIKIIYLAGFLFSISIALTSYVNSSFLKIYLSESSVGILYAIASIITILIMLEMPRILNRIGNRNAIILFSIFSFFSFLLLALTNNQLIIIIAFIIYFLSSNFIFISLDIFIENFSKSSSIGKFRGLYLTVISFAWVIAQAISGSIIAKSSYKGIYLFGALFVFLFSFIFISFLHNFKDPKYKKISILKTIKFFIANKNISKIYLINFTLKFFYVWMIIYTPIYLHEHLGFGWDKIGLIFTIMLLPFVFLSFPLGKLSDKIGEKKMLIVGFIVATLFTLLIPFTKEANFIVLAMILFGTRIGAATIEVMSESYFFKLENEEHPDAISFFRNTGPLSFVIAPLIATSILLLTPNFSYLFFVLGAILLCGLLITLRLKDVK